MTAQSSGATAGGPAPCAVPATAATPPGPPDRLHRFSADRPLTAADDSWLKRGLARALPDLDLAELFRIRPGLFRETDDLVVAADGGTGDAVAALGSRWVHTGGGVAVLHIGVQFVAQRRRGDTLFGRSWYALLEQVVPSAGFPWVSALKTYNPVAYCAMRAYGRLAGAVLFPDVQARRQDEPLRRLAAEVAGVLAPDHPYDPESGVISRIGVPHDLYRTQPTCADDQVGAYFRRVTRPGDRVLCVLHVRDPAVPAAILQLFGRRAAGPGRAEEPA